MSDNHARQLTRQDFEHLLAFRTSLRRFQRWSEDQARAAGLTHVQHQLLVAVKGHPDPEPPTVGELAAYLLQRHHSTVELVDRAEAAGLVRRIADSRDARVVRVQLTAKGERVLGELTPAHLVELHSLAAVLNELVAGAESLRIYPRVRLFPALKGNLYTLQRAQSLHDLGFGRAPS